MKYILLEIQKNNAGELSTLITTYDDKPHANAGFYSLAAVCELSDVPVHSAILMKESGKVVNSLQVNHGGDEENENG